jgi:hypothetical protein
VINLLKKKSWIAVFASVVIGGVALAATGGTSAALSPDALGAKAFLEGLLVKRYSLELATVVDRESFSLGAQIDLNPVTPVVLQVPKENKSTTFDPYTDLMLGQLDGDQLLKSVAGPIDERTIAQKFMENYRIRSVIVSVGLKDQLNPAVKGEVEKWLKKRLATEFGSSGKGFVSIIKRIPDKIEKNPEAAKEKAPKDIFEWAIQNQALAGQALMALAIIVGIVLWQLLSKILGTSAGAGAEAQESFPSASDEDKSDLAALQAAAREVQADQDKEMARERDYEDKDRIRVGRDIETLKSRLRELMPRLTGHLEDVIRQWCNMGDLGRLRLVCFAEAAFRDTGKLPIPVDALPEVQKIFSRMPELDPFEKRDALEKAYWDLLSTLNLGSDSLAQPFAYVENVGLNTIRKVLMEQNPRLRALVSIYMNKDMRGRYVKSLNVEGKKELLEQASMLTQIESAELETLDRGLMSKINPTLGHEIVPLDMSFIKIVDSLTLVEQITILHELKGKGVEEFKRSHPSLAFLGEWPDDKLKLLLMGLTPDELVAYLRVRPDLKDRVIGLASMMVAEIAKEELSMPDKTPAAETEKAIENFSFRLQNMVEQGDFNLLDVFGPIPEDTILQQLGVNNDGNRDDKRVA